MGTESVHEPECFCMFLLGMPRTQGHDDSLLQPFVRVGLVGAILRDGKSCILVAIKRKIPQAQCSSAAMQAHSMWNTNQGPATSAPHDSGEGSTKTNTLMLIGLAVL